MSACSSVAVLRVGINVTRLSIFALRGRVHIDQTYPLALSMIGGGCVGLLVGNRAAFLFRGTATLQAATLVFLLCGAVLMEAAGFGDAVQERATFAVAGCAALAALLALLRGAWRRASRSGREIERKTEVVYSRRASTCARSRPAATAVGCLQKSSRVMPLCPLSSLLDE